MGQVVDGQGGNFLWGDQPGDEFGDDVFVDAGQEVDQRVGAGADKPAAYEMPEDGIEAVDDEHGDVIAGDVERGGAGDGYAQIALGDHAIKLTQGEFHVGGAVDQAGDDWVGG